VNARRRYVRELEARLPFALGLRGRVVAEVREHLREGGEEALGRFGPVEELAAELAAELRIRAAARASWLVPAVVLAYVIPFYVVPENTLPPAPWLEKPEHLAWKQDVAVAAWLVALALGAVALALGRVTPRLALVPVGCSVAALSVAAVFGSIVAVQWIDAVPGTSPGIAYAGILASALLVLAVALVFAAALPHGRRELAPD
jgi:hypothetical protein